MRIDTPGSSGLGDVSDLAVAVVHATFNESVTGGLRDSAVAWLESVGVARITVVAAPGAFELPILARRLAGGHDAVVAVGAVIEGDTDHYAHVAHRTSEGLMQVMLETDTPVAFGVLTVRDPAHAAERSAPGPENKGAEAAEAAVRTAVTLRTLRIDAG